MHEFVIIFGVVFTVILLTLLGLKVINKYRKKSTTKIQKLTLGLVTTQICTLILTYSTTYNVLIKVLVLVGISVFLIVWVKTLTDYVDSLIKEDEKKKKKKEDSNKDEDNNESKK